MGSALRDKDDGYRGLLYNPVTKRYFRANAQTARRKDLERVSEVGEKPRVETSRAKAEAKADAEANVTAAVEAPPEQDASAANAAMDELLAEALACDDKEQLKVLGAQIGVKLTNNFNVETMRDRIKAQVETIKAATE